MTAIEIKVKDFRSELFLSDNKYIPEIKFYHDNILEEMEKINTLINKVNKSG